MILKTNLYEKTFILFRGISASRSGRQQKLRNKKSPELFSPGFLIKSISKG